MAGSIKIKNNINSELSILHTDDKPAKSIIGTDIAVAVDTINDFPLGASDGDTVIVRDLDRGGTFIYDSTKIAEHNGGTNFNGWIRQYSGAVNVKWFGAVGDGVTDDTVAIQSAIDYAFFIGGGEVIFDNVNCLITKPLTVGGNMNVTLRGGSNLESGVSKINCTGTHLFKFKSDQFSFLSLYNLSFYGTRLTTDLVDQSAGGSWAWSTVQGCYFVNFNITDILITGLHIINNNFQNHMFISFRGADYTIRDNYMNYDSTDTTKTGTDGCVTISASAGVNFSGNYITSMKTANAPIPLHVNGSHDIRVISNWLDGGANNSLKIGEGSDNVVATHNRIATIYSTNTPIFLSNVTDINVENNIIRGLAANANFLKMDSVIKRCTIKDNITNNRNEETVHGYNNSASTCVETYISGRGLYSIALTSGFYASSSEFFKVLTNTGTTTNLTIYIKSTSFIAGEYFYVKQTNTTYKIVVYDSDTSTAIYDTSVDTYTKARIISYEDGTCVAEQA